jgi:hypothetical protein
VARGYFRPGVRGERHPRQPKKNQIDANGSTNKMDLSEVKSGLIFDLELRRAIREKERMVRLNR